MLNLYIILSFFTIYLKKIYLGEEIRLQIIEILRKLLKIFPEEFLPILQDVALTISKALQDQYPNVKKTTA